MTTKIEAGSIRESALRIIMQNGKTAEEFIEDDANILFKFCCEGKSDINTFVGWVTRNLGHGGKIDPQYLRELLPHLQWIASGLFGKETASQVVTRLIELESALSNGTEKVLNFFYSNKVRIDNPKDDETRALKLLHKNLPVPQGKRPVPTQGIPVIVTGDIPQAAPVAWEPAPVMREPDEDEDEEKPPTAPPLWEPPPGLTREDKAPPPPPAASRNTAYEELERELASIRDLFAAPQPSHGSITVPPAENIPGDGEGIARPTTNQTTAVESDKEIRRAIEQEEKDPVRVFIRQHSDELGDPNEYGPIKYSAVKKESLGKGSYNIGPEDEVWFDNYEAFKEYLSGLTRSEMKIMKEIINTGGILSLNIGWGGWSGGKNPFISIDSDPKLEKAMYGRGLFGKSLFDRIRFGEYKVPKER